jgi:outer membrane protein insertion porin family
MRFFATFVGVLLLAGPADLSAEARSAEADAREVHPREGGQTPASPFVGRTVTAIQLVIEGVPSTEPALTDLIENRIGQPLLMHEVRDSITHLFSLGRFQDVQVAAEAADGGVRLRFDLVPIHAVAEVEFTGELGLSEGLLRSTVRDRFGARPSLGRLGDVVRLLNQLYEDRGYRRARIAPRTTELHDPDRTILTFEIASGPRARIGRVEIAGEPLETGPNFLDRINASPGWFYEHPVIEEKLGDYVRKLKRQGRYDAVASLRPPVLSPDGTTADLTIDVRPGPVITVVFEGDAIPSDKRDDLVPVKEEGSADEDLLEDSVRRIEEYLKQLGYWRGRATFERQLAGAQMRIVFTIRRGLQYRIAGGVEINGNRAIPIEELRPLTSRLGAGDVFIESHLDAAAAAIAAVYRRRGYAQVKVDASETELNPLRTGEGQIQPVIAITEGPLTLVGPITFTGSATVPESELRAVLRSRTGEPYFEPTVAADEDSLLLHYYNLGFAAANVGVVPHRSEDGTRVDLEFRIAEGPRILVDHVIIVGNRRTDPEVIRRELRLRPGEPLGLADRMESQRRLGALGLFRRVSVQSLSHGEDERQDVLVTVEEALATSTGYGGGFEIGPILRPGPSGVAEERFEASPRGFFEFGRRNLGGKNRSINLFTRFGLRPDDSIDEPGGSRFGYADYRVVATYRQPRLLGANDAIVTAAIEQGVRSSFNFARKGVTAEMNRRLAPGLRVAARYSFGKTETVDKGVGEEDQSFIDRLFPQVRLSSFSGAISRDTRDDVVEPTRGGFLSVEGSVAARALGGQVGFMKSYGQAFWFRRLPAMKGTVVATRAALGVADGFQRIVQATDATGAPIPDQFVVVEDLPSSERFFAGGDTTIRGFALDRVGAPSTISPSGFPKGGNSVLILNAELRFPAWHAVGPVVFVDGGNVFERVTDFDIGALRGAVGFGVRYRSPVGPIRVDIGFKLDRLPSEERRPAFHLSIGHAF